MIASLSDWQAHAGPKAEDQWVEGRSAYECANAWCSAGSPVVPQEIQQLLESHPATRGAVIEWAIPEHPVRFDKLRGEPRNSDMVLAARNRTGKIAISIEAKADEPFDQYVGDVVADAIDRMAHGERTGIIERVEALVRDLLPARLPRAGKLGKIRYQLLAATAGALAFAQEMDASVAVLVVHEFRTNKTRDDLHERNRVDFNRFAVRISSGAITHITDGVLAGPVSIPAFPSGPRLYLGKAIRNRRVAVT